MSLNITQQAHIKTHEGLLFQLLGPMALGLACTKFTSSYTHTLTISDPVYTT